MTISALVDEARAFAHARDFASAERHLRRVLEQESEHLVALDLLGYVLFFQGRPHEAEEACRRALAIEPARAYSTKGLGLCLARQGKVDEGVRFLREAIRLSSQWFDPRWDLAVVLGDAQRWDEADDVLRDAAAQLPQYEQRYLKLRQLFDERRKSQP